MTSSDERREVAERMRVVADGPYVTTLSFGEMMNSVLTDGAPRPTNYREMFRCLADLIDPTCDVADCGRQDGHTVCRGCSSCHGGWHEDVYDQPYAYCPRCGCRLVNGACHYCGARVADDE